MIFGSLLLIFAAIALSVLGVVEDSNALLIGSIAASLLAATALVVGARQGAPVPVSGVPLTGEDGWIPAGARLGTPANAAAGGAPAGTAPSAAATSAAAAAAASSAAADQERAGRLTTPLSEPTSPAPAGAMPPTTTPTGAAPVGEPQPVGVRHDPAGPLDDDPATATAPPVPTQPGPVDGRHDDASAGATQRPEGQGPDGQRPDPVGEPAVEPATAEQRARVARLSSDVYVLDGYPRYHLADCVQLVAREEEPEALPVSEAEELGFTPCSACAPVRTLLSA